MLADTVFPSLLKYTVSACLSVILFISLWPSAVTALDVDLGRCEVGGIPFERALKKDQEGNFTPEAEMLFTQSPANGIYLGMCFADVRHGQAMLIKLVPQDTLKSPQLIPRITYGMNRTEIETLFGQPDVHQAGQRYKQILLSGNRMGSRGRWAGLCPGFTVQFTFDDEAGLTRIVVLPMDVRAP